MGEISEVFRGESEVSYCDFCFDFLSRIFFMLSVKFSWSLFFFMISFAKYVIEILIASADSRQSSSEL